MTRIPKNLKKTFKNLNILHIEESKMLKICCNHFANYHELEEFSSINNDLVYLPGDLFDCCWNLSVICFKEKKFEFIDPDI